MEQKWPSRKVTVWKISRRGLFLRGAILVGAIAATCMVGILGKTPTSRREVFGVGRRYVPDILPVSLERGWISSEFGLRVNPRTGTQEGHQGIDLAVDEGVPVKAAADGKVIFAGEGATYGNLVKVDHGNGIETRYAHNSVLKVKTGDFVRRGQVIALAGHTGRVRGNPGDHLHYEVRIDARAVDPRIYLPDRIVEGGKTARSSAE